MIEILGAEGIRNAINELHIPATCTYIGEIFEVWELYDSDFEKLNEVPDEEWKDEWGWWRQGNCILEGSPMILYNVRGKLMGGYEPEESLNTEDNFEDLMWNEKLSREYDTYVDWLYGVFNLGNLKHIACFAISLAKDNGLTLADFMKEFQGEKE